MVNPKGKARGYGDSARARERKDEPMGYMLETRGLTKRFGRGDQAQDAVADVSLHIVFRQVGVSCLVMYFFRV